MHVGEDAGDAQAGAEQPDAVSTPTSVLPFPTGVLPQPLQRFVEEGAVALSCPPEFLAVPMLVIAGAAIGTSYVLEVKPGWRERPCLYAATVAPPGKGKSPPLDAVASPVHARQGALMEVWQDQMNLWEGLSPEVRPPRPILTRVVVDDTTTEALAPILKENPRGVIAIRDELSALVHSMNQYKPHGADRQFFLTVWSGQPVVVDRKGTHSQGPIIVSKPFLSVVGGITPDLLGELAEELGREDGFLHRLLFAFPESTARGEWTDATISVEARKAWRDALRFLWDLKVKGGLVESPHVRRLTPAARAVWIAFYNAHNAEMASAGFPYVLCGPWEKLLGYGARLALILHLSRVACGVVELNGEVDEVSMKGAVALVDYFKSHARRVYRLIPVSLQEKRDGQALAWIRKQGSEVTVRELLHHHVAGVKTAEEAKALVLRLQARGFGQVTEGEKSSAKFKLKK